MMAFSAFELSVLAEFADIYGEQVPDLVAQLDAATFTRRENTGGGFFTEFTVDHSIAPVSCLSPIGGLMVMLDGIDEGIDLLLFVNDGYASRLEGHSAAGEDTSSIDFAILPRLPITLRQSPLDDQTAAFLAALRMTPFRRRQ
ncbi:MAG TPA: hypothetical protein VG757_06975 [Devosia sp.]|nr:hypothetical protein [Devosia sp.]